jgi:phosphoribosylformylglycinamidine synthase
MAAEVEIAGAAGVRRVPLSAFLLGPRRVALAPGELLVAVGETRQELAGTEWGATRGLAGGHVPRTDPAALWPGYRAVSHAITGGLVSAAHAVGRGGLLHALFLVARAGGLGLAADLGKLPAAAGTDWEGRLLGESTGRFLLACRPERLPFLRAALGPTPHAVRGAFDDGGKLRITLGERTLVEAPVDDLARAWKRQEVAP